MKCDIRSTIPGKDDYCKEENLSESSSSTGGGLVDKEGASFKAKVRLKRDPVGTLATITEPESPEDGPSEHRNSKKTGNSGAKFWDPAPGCTAQSRLRTRQAVLRITQPQLRMA